MIPPSKQGGKADARRAMQGKERVNTLSRMSDGGGDDDSDGSMSSDGAISAGELELQDKVAEPFRKSFPRRDVEI